LAWAAALGIQRLLGLRQHLAPIPARAHAFRQLVAARLTEQLILLGVDARGVLEDLARDLRVVARRVMRRCRGDLRAVDRDHADFGPGRCAHTTPAPRRTAIAAPWRTRKRATVA
jgi:hypothetical protein